MENKPQERPPVQHKQDLLAFWSSFNDEGSPQGQVSFYDGDHFKEFSNWHLHDPFEFELPQNS